MSAPCADEGCTLPDPANRRSRSAEGGTAPQIIYVGDPMCSWCWGAAPGQDILATYAAQRGLHFGVRVGGLRPGGGEAWTSQFRAFLRHHWEAVAERSGQPFSYALLDRVNFHYDTEPACRAVVVARDMLAAAPDREVLRFFAAIQQRFYFASEDPTAVDFYVIPCHDQGLNFAQFRARFDAVDTRAATTAEFQCVRSWGRARASEGAAAQRHATVRHRQRLRRGRYTHPRSRDAPGLSTHVPAAPYRGD